MAEIYRTLDTELSQIRSLSLLPGQFHDPIRATLHTMSLDDSPQYEALSYIWGKELASFPAIIEGAKLAITLNLDIALRHLRCDDATRVLWVDAICIDQSNRDERADQVRLMQRIYHLSSVVLIWLGPATDDSEIVMQSIQDFKKQDWQEYDFQVRFMEILYRPWFTRTWVVQEFVLGKNHSLIGCGTKWVHWISFMAAWAWFDDGLGLFNQEYKHQFIATLANTFQGDWVEQIPQKTIGSRTISQKFILGALAECFGEDYLKYTGHAILPELIGDIRVNYGLWEERINVVKHCRYESSTAKKYWRRLELKHVIPQVYHKFLMEARSRFLIKKEPLPFQLVLTGTINLNCTDPRDKIYGILGLVSEKARENILVDYLQVPELTFIHTAVYIIKYEPDALKLFSLMWFARPFKTRCPSWVPNFTVSPDSKNEYCPGLLRGSCSDASWMWTMDLKISEDLTTLSGSGLSFGNVKELIHVTERHDELFIKQLLDIEALVERECPHNEPLWRTLVTVRNTDSSLLATGMPFDQRFEVLVGRSTYDEQSENDLVFVSELRSIIAGTLFGKYFFVTDSGFAGVATENIQVGDMLGLVFGMGRPAVLRQVTPQEVGVQMKTTTTSLQYHRIMGFAYIGCHNREEFEVSKDMLEDWTKHFCFRDRDVVQLHII